MHDYVIVGGGISGISVAEILSRDQNLSILLLEKNKKLATETSGEFHEWLHSGTLYTLVPDNLLTLRYLLGAADDLCTFYGGYNDMNLFPTEAGLGINREGWFNDNWIEYRFRNRKFNPIWQSLVSRSLNIIEMVNEHDWLRRRAGSEYGGKKISPYVWLNNWGKLYSNGEYYPVTSPDITMNSRLLLNDLVGNYLANGGDIKCGHKVEGISRDGSGWSLATSHGTYTGKKVVITSPDIIGKKLDIQLKHSYAPIIVAGNVPVSQKSFVELDYYTRTCINLLNKLNGYAQVGGISLSRKQDVPDYIAYLKKRFSGMMPEIEFVDFYTGLKKELVAKGQDRNYLYHIDEIDNGLWAIVLGKFSLFTSMSAEFYRRIYGRNPKVGVTRSATGMVADSLVGETKWQEISKGA